MSGWPRARRRNPSWRRDRTLSSPNAFGARPAPETCYIVCATPRSGSALLCEALGRTLLAGIPREYLREWSTDTPAALAQAGRFPPDAYMRKLFEECSTSNRVFGVKIMAGYLDVVVDTLRPFAEHPSGSGADVLASLFPNLQYIHLSRQDKVRQAVSLAKAVQTGQWHDVVVGGHSQPKPDAASAGENNAHYDFDLIAGHYQKLLAQEETWQAYFASAGLRPYRIVYEELERSYEQAGLTILDYLRIPHAGTVAAWEPALRRQSGAVNDEWAERFAEEFAGTRSASSNS